MVVAAGNQGYDLRATPTYPAVYSRTMAHVLTVGAIAGDDSWASFSNWDPTSVGLAAPGVAILSTVPGAGYQSWSGTR